MFLHSHYLDERAIPSYIGITQIFFENLLRDQTFGSIVTKFWTQVLEFKFSVEFDNNGQNHVNHFKLVAIGNIFKERYILKRVIDSNNNWVFNYS